MKKYMFLIVFLGIILFIAACSSEELDDIPIIDPIQDERISINYSPYTGGLSPELNSSVSLRHMRQHLDILKPYAHTLRTFGVSGELTKLYRPAKNEYGFRIIAGCWFDRNYSRNQIIDELNTLIILVNDGYIDIAVVGSELLFRGDIDTEALIFYIEYVKDGIHDKSIPVTTSDTAMAWINNPELVEVCDIILVTIYPFFSEVSVENAATALAATYEEVLNIAGDKTVIISETGWPTAGSSEGAAVPSSENAARYFNDVNEWSRKEGVEVIFFSAFDEAWKREGRNNDIGMHWGHFYEDGTLKEAYKEVS
ncbi:MAG: hypothetical protein LBC73_05130 [Oscillospiraceae bacterium]|jgi:exo-beta-1,3-glucanase (GH17 family)|nr:hypothetical protein [Oscillospiraceae bacterium]